MDIKILDSWLREFLITKAKPSEIAKYISLCGPSIERVHEIKNDFIYDIEITTNRIDEVGVYGIAREASVILPRFGIPAKLKKINLSDEKQIFKNKVSYLDANVDNKLCSRFTAVLIKNIKIGDSPKYIKERLESSNIRSINNVIDITNYLMLELGQPMHAFDYDKIKGHKMILRESKEGEVIKTLDGKVFELKGHDIVIEDGEGRLIDLAGVMGGDLSAVDETTRNVLLFVQTYDPVKIRKTSMGLAQRTMAATIFEKGTDTELVSDSILSGIKLFKSLTNGVPEKEILNIYPKPYKSCVIKLTLDYVYSMLGIQIPKKNISFYLQSLGFECMWLGNSFSVEVPSFRARDVKEKEDILEEIARIYGYHNLPSHIMSGSIPERPSDPKFVFENNIKNILSGFGGMEIYTLALTSKENVDIKNLRVRNPLGPETEYMRTSLMPSMIAAVKENIGTVDSFHLFEISNVYIPKTNNLPTEQMTLAGIFYGYSYRLAKGVIEGLLDRLNIKYTFKVEESKGFDAGKCAFIYTGKNLIGKIGFPVNTGYTYYEFYTEELLRSIPKIVSFKPISKYPAQIEDVTLKLPNQVKIGEILDFMKNADSSIQQAELKDIYKEAYTFRIWYQNNNKTLTNEDVEKIRKVLLSSLKTKFGIDIKE